MPRAIASLPNVVRLITGTSAALFLAAGSTQLVAWQIFPVLPARATASADANSADTSGGSNSARSLAERVLSENIFDASTGPLSWEPQSDSLSRNVGRKTQIMSGPAVSACGLGVRMVASVIDLNVAERSLVELEHAGRSLLYRAGSVVQGHQVLTLGTHRVLLRSQATGGTCELAMFDSRRLQHSDPAPAAEPAATPAPRAGRLNDAELQAGIKQLGPTRFEITRELLEKVLANRGILMRAARIVPMDVDGEQRGVKLLGMRRDGLLAKLGLENDDVVRSLNGFDLSSPDSALEAYAKLGQSDQLGLAILRGGKPLTVEYAVR